jgi:hypothetical protein
VRPEVCGMSDDVWRMMECCWKQESSERLGIAVVLKGLNEATRFWNPPRLTTATSEADSSINDDSDTSSDSSSKMISEIDSANTQSIVYVDR